MPQKKKTITTKKSSHPLQEGIFGWLYYLSFAFIFTFPILGHIFDKLCAVDPYYKGYVTVYEFPIYGLNQSLFPPPILLLPCFGVILMLILPWISFYKLTSKKITLLLKLFPILLILSAFILFNLHHLRIIFLLLSIFISITCFAWYLYYFYKRSKSGYRYVFLKVILFLIIPFLPLLYFHQNTFYQRGEIEVIQEDYQ